MNRESKNDFWDKQFSENTSPKQNWFDITFGIVVPILCLIFDPIVFRNDFHPLDSFGGSGYLNRIQIFAYLSIGFGIIILAIWLSLKITSKFLTGVISGIFFSGALLALALGVFLIPISIVGLMIVIGVLGFTQFLTAFVFLRNGTRAFHRIQSETSKGLLFGAMLLGVFLVVGIPLATNWKASRLVSQSTYTIIHSEKEEEVNLAIDTLQSAFWCSNSCYDEVVWAYEKEENKTRQTFLSEVYLKLTGESIEQHLWLLND